MMLRGADIDVMFSVAYGGEIVAYTPLGGAARFVRMLPSIANRFERVGDVRGEIQQPRAEIPVADVATPANGDQFVRKSGQAFTIRAFDLDEQGLVWILELAKQ